MSALIQCHFDYACTSWYSGLSKKSKSKLQVIQNNVIRLLLNHPSRSHIGLEDFKKADLLPVEYRVRQLKLNHTYNIYHHSAPSYLSSKFILTSHNRTRNSASSFILDRVGSYGLNSFIYTSVKLWNALPLYIRQSTSKEIFKKRVRKHFISKLQSQDSSHFQYY